ncbi:hypothetical protein MUK42_03448 [Musa troglodytarum]|uniref:Uncharacterized protein n=1 Tax=Musa troglodytarum TaxID=320322 RepID=A0A9E7KFB7_9LILI|nr:hypothetical protein MUK42_03448 [Musa troglodytarum]URE15321.1 hypothetical protein MUK42_03448 [Musa troglodytarum]
MVLRSFGSIESYFDQLVDRNIGHLNRMICVRMETKLVLFISTTDSCCYSQKQSFRSVMAGSIVLYPDEAKGDAINDENLQILLLPPRIILQTPKQRKYASFPHRSKEKKTSPPLVFLFSGRSAPFKRSKMPLHQDFNMGFPPQAHEGLERSSLGFVHRHTWTPSPMTHVMVGREMTTTKLSTLVTLWLERKRPARVYKSCTLS